MVAQRVRCSVEERRNLLVRLLLHAVQNLFNQMRLVAATRLHDQLPR
jgi:hypothetical protein